MEYRYNDKLYVLDQELYDDKVFDIVYQYTHYRLDGNINRYDVIVDPECLKNIIIDTILCQIPNATLMDLSIFNNKNEYLSSKEEFLRNNQVLVCINQKSLIEKLPFLTPEEREAYFYHNIINFLCDSYSKEGINYQEIMFYTNQEYRRYIKYAYDISSRSNTIFFNNALVDEQNRTLTLDDTLEREYHNKRN